MRIDRSVEPDAGTLIWSRSRNQLSFSHDHVALEGSVVAVGRLLGGGGAVCGGIAGGASPADLNATNLLIKPEEVIDIDSSERLDHQF